MANLKNKILQALQNGKNVETILNDLSTIQENLLKNHSNPVFTNKDKNKILKQFINLQNIGKSLYRYNVLSENNLKSDSERADIENTVLKGGISYNKYVWHSENGEHTCEVCRSLDGQVFDFYDEVPERPHPNCRCMVEVVEEEESKQQTLQENEEPCDCITKLSTWALECNNACNEIENLISESEDSISDIEDILRDIINYSNNNIEILIQELGELIEKNIFELYDIISQAVQTISIFKHNLDDLIAVGKEVGHYVDYSAEYYHTKANCEAAQLGDVGEFVATILGYLREFTDFPKEILIKGYKIIDAFEHSVYDLKINEMGRKLGRENPDKRPEDIIPIPEGLPKEHI